MAYDRLPPLHLYRDGAAKSTEWFEPDLSLFLDALTHRHTCMPNVGVLSPGTGLRGYREE